MTTLPRAAERYLHELERCLSDVPQAERTEIVEEIRSHLLERSDAAADPVRALGSAEEYARSFVQERALAGALVHGTSWGLGRALVAGVGRVTWWYVVVVLGVAHVYGIVLVGLAALKPLFPANIGVFVGRSAALGCEQLVIGARYGPDLAGVRELLGWSAIPVFFVPGVLVLWGANFTLRALARWRLAAVVGARTRLAGAAG